MINNLKVFEQRKIKILSFFHTIIVGNTTPILGGNVEVMQLAPYELPNPIIHKTTYRLMLDIKPFHAGTDPCNAQPVLWERRK